MTGRPSTITVEQREEFWRRYKAGESVLGIIGALRQRPGNINRVLEASGGIAPMPRRRSERVLSRPVDRSFACSAKTSNCSGSLRLNCSMTGLRSRLQAGSEITIPVIRRCGCHTRRSIEPFLSRRAVP